MYMPLFRVRYLHEYFDGTSLFDMNCSWPSGMQKLIQDMGLLVVPTSGELEVMFDSTIMEREEELKPREQGSTQVGESLNPQEKLALFRQLFCERWNEEVLTLYFTPKESKIFHNVTDGLSSLVSARKSKDQDGKTVILPKCFRFFGFAADAVQSINGVDLPVTALDQITTLDEISTEIVNIDQSKKIATPSLDVSLLKKIVNHQVLFVVSVRISELQLAFEEKNSEPLLTLKFDAVKIHYKYYFTKIAPDKDLHVVSEDETAFGDITYSQVNEQYTNKDICAFISDQPVDLRWQQDKYFKLIRNAVDSSQTVIPKLPHPSPTRYYKHQVLNQTPIKVLEAFIN